MRSNRVSSKSVAFLALAAVVLRAAPSIAAEWEAVVAPSETVEAEAASAAEPRKDDYYTRRAKTILETEGKLAAPPHPLAAKHPDRSVIVCEAGCATPGQPQIVAMQPKADAPRKPGRMLEPSATQLNAAGAVECVAGCYDGEQDLAAAGPVGPEPKVTAQPKAADGPPESWVTTVGKPKVRERLSPVR